MDRTWKFFVALPVVALMAGCVSGGGTTTNAETVEETVDGVDLDGDGSVEQSGVEVGQVN